MSSPSQTIKIRKLSQTCIVPKRQTPGSAGYDLYSDERAVIGPNTSYVIQTGISMQLPKGTYGRVAPRSSMASKFTSIGAGVVDSDYRGEVKVLFFNHSSEYIVIKHGERIAQLIVEKIATPEIEIVEELDDTDRGEGGFGSTGK